MHHQLKALKPRDIAKNTINAAVAAAAYKYTRDQVVQRTEHDRDEILVRATATAAGSTASLATRPSTERYVDKIADWLVARRKTQPDALVTKPNQS